MRQTFYDIPVYRVNFEKYYKARDQEIDTKLHELWNFSELSEKQLQSRKDSAEDQFYKQFGPWQFNEIVGYIRLYFLGTQIRGEYFSAETKRTVKTRKKVFSWRAYKLAAEVQLWQPISSASILQGIEEYLGRCRDELVKNRYLDTEVFDQIAPFVDWLSVFKNSKK